MNTSKSTEAPAVAVQPFVRRRLGDIVWSILPDTEAAGYGEEIPRKPWRAAIASIQGVENPLIRICAADSRNVMDEDSNSSAYCGESDLFDSEDVALVKWCHAMQDYIEKEELKLVMFKEALRLVMLRPIKTNAKDHPQTEREKP